MAELLKLVHFFSCTTDLWTSRARHAYVSLTVHYLNDNFRLCTHLLEVKEFDEAHTGFHIAEELEAILQHWNVSLNDLVAFTTDNGSNVASAIASMSCIRMPCLSYCLNLAVEKACSIQDISKALARCRRLVSHFNHSAKSSYFLKQKQESFSHPIHNLIQDVTTRWNLSYYMVARIIEQQQPICATLLELRKSDLMPSESEFTSMETYVDIMTPLVKITEAIGADKWVTISSVRPILYKLLSSHLVTSENETRLGKKMKSEMLTDLQKRYTDDAMLLLGKASFLDPRMKALPFLSSSERTKIIDSIVDDVLQIPESNETEKTNEPPEKRKKGEHVLFKMIDDIMHSTTDEDEPTTITNLQKMRAEIQRYSSEPNDTDDPLDWWKANSFRYPLLSHLARKYLAIPATSVPSERVFSAAGHVVNKKRACLDPSSVNMLVFFAENL